MVYKMINNEEQIKTCGIVINPVFKKAIVAGLVSFLTVILAELGSKE